jgi:outer membrane receptor protein involved in Fe transport
MGLPGLRRAETVECASRFLSLYCLILALAVSAPGAAADADDESDPIATPAPAGEPAAAPSAAAAPVRSVGEVTVTATRAERDVLEVPGNVTVIEREQIERSGARTVPELLRRQSGLFVTNSTTNPADTRVDARGFNNGGGNGGNLLVQVDGRRTTEPDLGVTDWALLSLDMVERIEIVRGSTSAMYGDNAAAGVINIRTRPQEGPPRGSVRGHYGRYDTGGGSLIAAATAGPATFSLFIDGVTSDGYRDNSAFDDQNYEGTFEWNFGDRVLIGVRGGYHDDSREFPGGLTGMRLATLGRRAANPNTSGAENDSDVERGYVQGWIEAILAEEIELRIQPFYRDRNDDATIVGTFGGPPTTTLTDAEKLGGGVDVQLRVDRPLFGRENRFIVGFEFLHEEVDRDVEDPFFPNISDNERDVYGVFLQEEFHLTDALLIAAGVRFDRALLDLDVIRLLPGERVSDNPRYSEWSPKASITWRILPMLSVYGSYTRGFRLPTLDEASPLFGTIPDLDAQVSDAGEIGAKYRGERFEGSLSLYYMMVEDEILWDNFLFTNENLDRVRHRGIEASLDVQIVSWLFAYANYTFDDVKILDADDPLVEGSRMPIAPKHRGTLGVFAKLPYDLEIGANGNIVGDRTRANDFNRQVAKLDRYGTLDLLFAWRPSFGERVQGALTFALRNVTAEEYEDFGSRDDWNPDTFTPDPTAFFFPAAKRTWEVGLMFTVRP